MSLDTAAKTLKEFRAECIECDCCLKACSMLAELGLTPAEIFRQALDGRVDEDVLKTIQRCALCGLCSQSCPVNLEPAQAMAAARELLLQTGQMSLEDYQAMLVDQDWHFFTIFRQMWGISYDDLRVDRYDTLFFPGCTLASYAPELTRAAHAWLQGQGFTVGFSDQCCGLPLSSIGLAERDNGLLADLSQRLRAAGARQLVTTCPNCYYHLQNRLGEVKVVSIYDLMVKAGIQAGGGLSLTIHDACADRFSQAIGREVRHLLAGYPLVEMEHHGATALCCGSGGIVSMVDPELCQTRAQTRLAEFDETGAARCVTACMGCAKRLVAALPAGSGASSRVIHLLELIFDLPVDHNQVQQQVTAMWQGEWGDYNLQLLAQARPVTMSGEGHA